jgi:hypothetical protein
MKKLTLLAVLAVGYVLGARAGRERYEQIRSAFLRVKNDPRVQEKAQQAVDVARDQAPVVADKVTSAAGAAASKVTGRGDSGDAQDSLEGQVHHMAGPQGDLP